MKEHEKMTHEILIKKAEDLLEEISDTLVERDINQAIGRLEMNDCEAEEILKEFVSDKSKDDTSPFKDWFFSFGSNHHPYSQCYVKICGSYEDAREKMIKDFGTRWAFQYGSAEECGVERYGLTRLEKKGKKHDS